MYSIGQLVYNELTNHHDITISYQHCGTTTVGITTSFSHTDGVLVERKSKSKEVIEKQGKAQRSETISPRWSVSKVRKLPSISIVLFSSY